MTKFQTPTATFMSLLMFMQSPASEAFTTTSMRGQKQRQSSFFRTTYLPPKAFLIASPPTHGKAILSESQSTAVEEAVDTTSASEQRPLASNQTAPSTSSTSTASNSQDSDQNPAKKKKAPSKNHNQGVFSPVVLFMKELVGDQRLNKIRGNVIAAHSNVIGSFVETSETTEFGNAVLRALFQLADKNKDGAISKEELQTALQSLGFSWLQDKQVVGLFEKADKDGNGTIDVDEWQATAPKALRTNLIKLAKKNGGDMGLLA